MDVISYVNALPLAGLAVHGAMPAVNRAYTTDTVEAHNALAFSLADTPSTTKAAFTIPSLVAPERLLERARKLEAEIDALGSVAIPAEDGKHGAVEASLNPCYSNYEIQSLVRRRAPRHNHSTANRQSSSKPSLVRVV